MSPGLANPWIENWEPRPEAQVRLFCFPHVGGGASIYRSWPQRLDERIELLAVELPGRGRRFGEAPFRSLAEALRIFHASLDASFFDKPFFLFGHSMGALLAYEWSWMLAEQGRVLPKALALSAFGAPHRAAPPRRFLHDLPDLEFIGELQRLKGTPSEVLQHRELMDLLMPMIRADLQMVETYRHAPRGKLTLPFLLMGGQEDVEVAQERLEAWRELTDAGCKLEIFPGDHFFIQSAKDRVIDRLSHEIQKYLCV